tara:strand:- start:4634 stop:5584 length:951 start_codon:yes stop_codon:yes gene_type:complete
MKVLVIQQRYGIGDMVILTPYLHAISKKYETPITLLAKESSKAKDLFSEDDHFKEIITLDKSKDGFFGIVKLANEIRSKNFDKIFIFNNSLRYKIIAKIAKVKEIYQYQISFFKQKDVMFRTAKNFTEKILNKSISSQPHLIFKNNKGTNNFFKSINESYKIIVLGVSASGPTKRWDIENYIKLTKSLSKITNCKFLIAAGPKDDEIVDRFKKSVSNNDFLSLADFKIRDMIPILKKANVYIGNDTGFLHICAALDKKCLGLFMDSPAKSYSAYSDNINVSVPDGETIESTTHKTRGKDKISFDDVLMKARKILLS